MNINYNDKNNNNVGWEATICVYCVHDYRRTLGVTLAQLVKTSAGQADVQRFEPHLGHDELGCSVLL